MRTRDFSRLLGVAYAASVAMISGCSGGGDSPSGPITPPPPPPPTTVAISLTLLDGDRQQAPTASAVPVAPVVLVRDAGNQVVANVALRCSVSSGGGSIASASAVSDAAGRASCDRWTLGSVGGQTLRVESADTKYVLATPLTVSAIAVAAGGATVGPPRTTTLASPSATSVLDTVTGLRFTFPQGATGTLEVARVQPFAVEPSAGLTRFMATFTGPQSMEVAVPLNGGELSAFFYGEVSSVATSGPAGARWWALPIARVRNDTGFAVLKSATTTSLVGIGATAAYRFPIGRAANPATPPKVQAYATVPMPASSPTASIRRQYRTAVEQVIDWWKTTLSPAGSARLAAAIAADPWNFSTGSSGDSYYAKGFWTSGYPWIYYNTGKELTISARHEGSHYVSHMLLGETRYREIEDFVPGEGHDLGRVASGFRNSIIEEYPHIANFLMSGALDNHDLRSVSSVNNFRDLMSAQPDKVDFPSLEGFGAGMMAALTRAGSDTLVYDFSYAGSRTRSPAFGVSARQIADALASGPRNPNELREALVPLAGSAASLAALVEPLGWSYQGSGRVVDERGVPVAGAVLASVVTASNGKSYRTVGGTPTGTDGKFWMPRLYPGESKLRAYTTKVGGGLDSLDVLSLSVPWTKATTDTVGLGDIVVPSLTAYNSVYIVIDGVVSPNTLGTDVCRPNFFVSNMLSTSVTTSAQYDLSWSGLTFSANGAATYEVQGEYSGSLRTRSELTMATQGTLIPGRGDTLWVNLTASSNDHELAYQIDPVTRVGKWITVVTMPTAISLRNFPLRVRSTTPASITGKLTGNEAVAAMMSGSFEYYNVSPYIPTFHPQSCMAYTTGPNFSIEVRLLQR